MLSAVGCDSLMLAASAALLATGVANSKRSRSASRRWKSALIPKTASMITASELRPQESCELALPKAINSKACATNAEDEPAATKNCCKSAPGAERTPCTGHQAARMAVRKNDLSPSSAEKHSRAFCHGVPIFTACLSGSNDKDRAWTLSRHLVL